MYISRILYGIDNMITYQFFLYDGLDNVFALQIPSFKCSQIVFAPFQNLFWCVLNVNFYH
jgi:hypothetical protein